MKWQPKIWIAVVLGFFLQSLAMLYLLRIKWAVTYFVLTLAIAISEYYATLIQGVTWLNYFSFNYLLMLIGTGHAYWLAKHFDGVDKRPWYSRWYGLISILIAVTILSFAPLRTFFYESFHLPASSMAPTYPAGSVVWVEKWGYGNYRLFGFQIAKTGLSKELKRGDVILFNYPEDTRIQYIKRVIGLPGDTLEYRDKRLTINGIPADYEIIDQRDQQQLSQETIGDHTNMIIIHDRAISGTLAIQVPTGQYFVMGDNRDNSRDSRYWGYVPAGNIIGKVMKIYLAPE